VVAAPAAVAVAAATVVAVAVAAACGRHMSMCLVGGNRKHNV